MRFGITAHRKARERFEREIVPHLDCAFNLARWLTGNDDDAADVLQEASLRAFKSIEGLLSNSGKSWFLTIVRNTSHSFLRRKSKREKTASIEDELEAMEWDGPNPEQSAFADMEREIIATFLEELPAEYREVIVLRELEDLSYKEISEITQIPIGTVMSRLSRARLRLQRRAADRAPEGWQLGL